MKNKNIIIFNGEIYNFKELKSELQSFGQSLIPKVIQSHFKILYSMGS